MVNPESPIQSLLQVTNFLLDYSPGRAVDDLADPLDVRIAVPDGSIVTETSPGLEVEGDELHWSGTLASDVQLTVRYSRSVAP